MQLQNSTDIQMEHLMGKQRDHPLVGNSKFYCCSNTSPWLTGEQTGAFDRVSSVRCVSCFHINLPHRHGWYSQQ